MKKEYQQDAFPSTVMDGSGVIYGNHGMTLLDYFAAKAMQGCLAYSHYNASWGDYHSNTIGVAVISYELAAAMMEERKKYINE